MKRINTSADKLPALNETQSIKQIRKLHGEIFEAARTSLPKAIRIGELLTGIKDKMEHGQWLPWIQKNLLFSERTAQNYIRCFDEKDRLKNAMASDLPLSVSGALALLSEPKTEPAPLPQDAARVALARELDAQICQSLDDIKTAAADSADGELPPGFIGRDGFMEFIKSRGQSLGVALTAADKNGLNVIILYLSAGAVVSRDTILKILQGFNPTREMELAA